MFSKKTQITFLVIFLSIVTFLSLFFRFKGIRNNDPFWTDEFSSAHQARYILKYGISVFSSINKLPIYFEDRNMTTHFLVAFFFKLFGQKESVARMPIVLIGSLIPLIMFCLARLIFGLRVAILSSLFIAFSYFEIVWSRQARGYIIQQFLTILTIYLYLRLLRAKNKKFYYYIPFFIMVLLGILTHPIFYLLMASIIIHYLCIYRIKGLTTLLKQPLTHIALIILMVTGYKIGIFSTILSNLFKINNLWYYHAFLWREYELFTFLTITGTCISIILRRNNDLLITIYMLAHLLFLTFLLGPYTSRYLNAMFPFLYLFSAYTIVQITDIFLAYRKIKTDIFYKIIPVSIAFLIILSGHKFVTKAKFYYSINHDFREVALIDYHKIYSLIKTKGNFVSGNTTIIETWPDRLHWYMGQDFFDAYELKWKISGISNGIPTGNVPYFYNGKKEKMTKRYRRIGLINEVVDLQKAIKKYPKGFIFIDDSSLPKDVIDYAEKHFKKELYLDHYPLDDNPYSIWPATLYSWGIP